RYLSSCLFIDRYFAARNDDICLRGKVHGHQSLLLVLLNLAIQESEREEFVKMRSWFMRKERSLDDDPIGKLESNDYVSPCRQFAF
ncbi:hypothetical protein PENTCL1PPCAC_8227, partial [Pristionchus entomophagus]